MKLSITEAIALMRMRLDSLEHSTIYTGDVPTRHRIFARVEEAYKILERVCLPAEITETDLDECEEGSK
jgi:hypothetical protein